MYERPVVTIFRRLGSAAQLKGASFDTKLPKKQYKTKWIIAEKA